MLETSVAVVLVNVTWAWQRQGKGEERRKKEGWVAESGPDECHMGVKGGDGR